MADPASDPSDDAGSSPADDSTAGTPRWAKVFGIVLITLLLLFVILQLTGLFGEHGPRRHMPSGDFHGFSQPVAEVSRP